MSFENIDNAPSSTNKVITAEDLKGLGIESITHGIRRMEAANIMVEDSNLYGAKLVDDSDGLSFSHGTPRQMFIEGVCLANELAVEKGVAALTSATAAMGVDRLRAQSPHLDRTLGRIERGENPGFEVKAKDEDEP